MKQLCKTIYTTWFCPVKSPLFHRQNFTRTYLNQRRNNGKTKGMQLLKAKSFFTFVLLSKFDVISTLKVPFVSLLICKNYLCSDVKILQNVIIEGEMKEMHLCKRNFAFVLHPQHQFAFLPKSCTRDQIFQLSQSTPIIEVFAPKIVGYHTIFILFFLK